jgi:hypothetical protein
VDDPELEKINSTLCFDTPECKIIGGVDLFTTKPTGTDKKLFKTIDKQLDSQHQDSLLHQTHQHAEFPFSSSVSPPTTVSIFSPPDEIQIGPGKSLSSSPFGPLDQAASRKVFTYLISVLNAAHPDHDFTALQPQDFKKETNCTKVINAFNNILFGLGMPLRPHLWDYLDKQMDLSQCAIYSHTPPQSFLQDEPGVMWSVMWFFFNKRRKRVAHLHLQAVRHHHYPPLSTPVKRHVRSGSSIEDEEEYDLTYSSDTSYNYIDEDEVVGGLEMDD